MTPVCTQYKKELVEILSAVCNRASLAAECYVIFSSTLVLFGVHSL